MDCQVLQPWLHSMNCCIEPGIICSNHRITEIHLSNRGLHGAIPPMHTLTKLTVLDLSNNQISGTIPTMPKSLRSLNLSNTQITGALPVSISQLDVSNTNIKDAVQDPACPHNQPSSNCAQYSTTLPNVVGISFLDPLSIILIVAGLFILVLSIFGYYIYRKRQTQKRQIRPVDSPQVELALGNVTPAPSVYSPMRITAADLDIEETQYTLGRTK